MSQYGWRECPHLPVRIGGETQHCCHMLPPGHVPPRNNGIIYPGPVESWVTPWKLRRKKHFTVFVCICDGHVFCHDLSCFDQFLKMLMKKSWKIRKVSQCSPQLLVLRSLTFDIAGSAWLQRNMRLGLFGNPHPSCSHRPFVATTDTSKARSRGGSQSTPLSVKPRIGI